MNVITRIRNRRARKAAHAAFVDSFRSELVTLYRFATQFNNYDRADTLVILLDIVERKQRRQKTGRLRRHYATWPKDPNQPSWRGLIES